MADRGATSVAGDAQVFGESGKITSGLINSGAL